MCFHTAQEKFRSSALNVALNIKAISKPQARASVRLVENGSDPHQIPWLLKKNGSVPKTGGIEVTSSF